MSASKSSKSGKVNVDLLRERRKCTFNIEELTNFIDGGKDKTDERRAREQYFLDDPTIRPAAIPTEYMSHKEKYEDAIRISCALFKRVKQYQNEFGGGVDNFRDVLGNSLGSAFFADGNPFQLHYVMFLPTLVGQGNTEDIAEWIQKAWDLDIIGTYAQTELGHGTFIRGLETTATYDPKTEEFVINSPTLTSYKWWPGGLGNASNYAIVMAQLYTRGTCHGIHPFIVQLRDEETNQPLAGIKIGEIGVKLGMNGSNNGFLGFDNIRIPRTQMLMKNNKVHPDGTYIQSPSTRLTYGTMIFVRVLLVADAAQHLKKAVTIATRYSSVRRQSHIHEDRPETQVIDFVTQQYKLFPLIATFFAFSHSSQWVWNMHNQIMSEMEDGQLDRLPELHAIACCLKSVSTSDCARGIETCRQACGGHGYMICSNLPTIYALCTAACTYEGENTVLLLQTARYLIKTYQGVLDGQSVTPTIEYLAKARSGGSVAHFQKSPAWIISALEYAAARKIAVAYENVQKRSRNGIPYEDAWNMTSVQLASAAEFHCRVNVLKIYQETMTTIRDTISSTLFKVLWQLYELYAVDTALKLTGDLLRFTDARAENVNALQAWLEELLHLIRPNAVAIVDAFDIRDEILRSALGSYDGNVYERLFDSAMKSPLNQEQVNQSFHKHLQPFLKSNL